MKIAIACGGTGGHLFPGLAVGELLIERGHEVMLIISEKKIDDLAVQGRDEFIIKKLPAIGMPSIFSPAMIGFIGKFLSGLNACKKIFSEFAPDAVLGMGGFTSTAPILAGRMRGVPTFIHESNAIPGKANKLNAKLSKFVLLGVDECARYLPKDKCQVVGTPVRSALRVPVNRDEAIQEFGLDSDKKTLLVIGGSQGASGINHALSRRAKELAELGLQMVHFTGERDAETVKTAYVAAGLNAHVAPFYHEMQNAYAVADLVIARAGASSLSEIAYFGIPSILIPYPYAAEDHQTRNAEVFSAGDRAVIMQESSELGERLINELKNLIQNTERLNSMSAKVRELAPEKSAARVADCIEKVIIPR